MDIGKIEIMTLGARLTRLRLEKGESLQEVADAVGVSHFGVSLANLVGEDASADQGRIGRMFRQAAALDPDDVALLDDMMRSLLRRRGKSR